MAVVKSSEIQIGSHAPDFRLESIDGRSVGFSDLTAPVIMVAFVCNHCPYVQHMEREFGRIVEAYKKRGVATVGICSNDAQEYPDDTPAGLREQLSRASWTFPYLVDETQEVGRAYRAACTPDLFVFDAERRLAYHGAMDASTPKSNVPLTGDLLRGALDLMLAGKPVLGPQRPAMGCSIKWRDA